MNSKILFVSLTALISSACSDDSKDKIENKFRAPELQSEWAGGCEDVGIFPLSASAAFSFESLKFTRTQYVSMDGSCATQDIAVTYKGEYSVSKPNDAQKNISALPIDLSYKTVVVKPLTAAGKDTLNTLAAVGFCSHADWEVNVEKDLTKESTETGCALIDLPEMQYDIVSTEGGILRFGATTVGQHAPTKKADRPTAFNGISLNKQ